MLTTFSFVAVLLLQLLCLGDGASFISTPPKIQVTGNPSGRYFYSRSNDASNSGSINITAQKGNIFIVPSQVGQLVLNCNASYPVMWNLVDSDINSEMFPYVHVRTKRFAGDLFDPTSFNYTSQMILEGPSSNHKFSGNYSCQNTAKRNVQTNVFIYWEGSGLETLVHSKQTVTTYVKSDGTVVLPCGISSPNFSRPKLEKQDSKKRKTFTEINLNKSVSYNPTSGFILKASLPNPIGVYKCIVNEESEDVVTVIVKNLTSKTIKNANATFKFDSETNEIVCCSGSKRAPNIFLMYCDHAVTCQYREHVIEPYHYIFSRSTKSKKDGCARKTIRFYHTLLIRCIGDGIDEYKEMITPVRTPGYNPWSRPNKTVAIKTYFGWEQIESQEMVAVEIHQSNNNLALYNKQTINVECSTSQYYFSEGNYWAIRWKNKTLTPITVQNTVSSHRWLMQSDVLSYTLDMSMDSLLCFAPVWNSSVWVMKTVFLYVNETTKPTLLDNSTLEYTWTTNETFHELVCEGEGTPEPSFSWMQGDTPLYPYSSHNYNMTTTTTKSSNGTNVVKAVLKIIRVADSTRGQFICTASNFGGTISKSFKISVISPSTSSGVTILVVSGIIIVVLLIAMGVVWKVMKIDQKAINHLTSVHFKEPTIVEQTVSTDVTNTTYDNGKWTNQLIN